VMLADLIRGKSGVATATPATCATPDRSKGRTVATVATVAVAKSGIGKPAQGAASAPPTAPMTAEQERAIRAWLALIGETDPASIRYLLEECQRDETERAHFLARAAAHRRTEVGDSDEQAGQGKANRAAQAGEAANRREAALADLGD